MPKKLDDLPEVIELSEADVQKILHDLENSTLDPNTKKIAINSVKLAVWFPQMLESKNISIRRLRRVIFGNGYTLKKDPKLSQEHNNPTNDNDKTPIDNTNTAEDPKITQPLPPEETSSSHSQAQNNKKEKEKKPGHGRLSHTTYADCEKVIQLPMTHLKSGDLCPELCGGRVCKQEPGNIIRIKGQNLARVLHYIVEKLRCALCGKVFSADLPANIGTEKYDAAFKSILVLQKYYVGVPFYRQENFQALLNFPLPDSTQWDLIEKVAQYCWGVFNYLKYLAANGQLIHNDDTTLKILDHIKKIKHEVLERVGMFTTGIFAEYQGHPIALFLNGTQHAGENLNALLERRDPGKSDIIQMCDGLSRNTPKAFKTILCNCLSHGFRKFEELLDYYPDECFVIIHDIGAVYKIDEKTASLSAEERLLHHQQYSQPIMNALRTYIDNLLIEHVVEPNGELGKAIIYMQKRWERLTRFLSVAGAPLDNNVVERALKLPIRLRNNSLFYRSEYSAQIGGMLTSLIYTAQLAKVNPQHYLTTLQNYRADVSDNPSQWLPWNYHEALAKREAT
jgi:transposase